MPNLPVIKYQDRYIFIAQDEASFFYDVTNSAGRTLHTSTDSYPTRGEAELAARRYVETHLSPEMTKYNRKMLGIKP